MFKSFLLLAAMTLAPGATTLAQAPKVALSEAFEEPTSGAVRLLYMKSGNTLYFHFTPNDGIRVTVFDDHHKQKAQTTLTSSLWNAKDMKRSELKGLFEINGQAVIFLLQITEKVPSFYRIVLDPQTGHVSREDKIGELPRGGYNFIGAAPGSALKAHDFYVEKDPESDYYATIQYDHRGEDKSKRILVTHFAPDHQEVNHAYFDLPGTTFKNTDYQAFSVHKDEYVFLLTYGNNDYQGKDAKLVMATLSKGSNQFRTQLIAQSLGFQDVMTGIQYDAASQNLRLLIITSARNLDTEDRHPERRKKLALLYIDPVKLQVKYAGFLQDTYINNYVKDKLHYKNDYQGMPQDFRINPDGTSTVMLEELDDVVYQSNQSGGTQLLGIGIAQVDAQGHETGGYAVAKSQEIDEYYGYWFNYRRNRGGWSFRLNGYNANKTLASFFSYQYLHPINTEYVLFNDHVKNIRNQSEDYHDKKLVKYVSQSSTVCYRRKDGQLDKFFLYGDPGDRETDRYSILEATAYTPDQKKMVTIMVERDGRKDAQAHVAWIDFE